jgi:hypothetical protein
VLGSIGSVGDAYDNAMAESFVDSFKTELIADRVWRTRTQLELAIVEGSPGSTTTASTRASVTVPLPRWKHSTKRSTLHLPLSITEQREPQTRSPSIPAGSQTGAKSRSSLVDARRDPHLVAAHHGLRAQLLISTAARAR